MLKLKMDSSYFKEWISPILYEDISVQGNVMHKFKAIKEQIKQAKGDDILKFDKMPEYTVFEILLQFHQKISKIFSDVSGIYIVIREYNKINHKKSTTKKFPFLSDLTNVHSSSIRFANCTDTNLNYSNKIYHIIYTVLSVHKNNSFTYFKGEKCIMVDALGYDRIFIKYCLLKLLPSIYNIIIYKSNLYLFCKRYNEVDYKMTWIPKLLKPNYHLPPFIAPTDDIGVSIAYLAYCLKSIQNKTKHKKELYQQCIDNSLLTMNLIADVKNILINLFDEKLLEDDFFNNLLSQTRLTDFYAVLQNCNIYITDIITSNSIKKYENLTTNTLLHKRKMWKLAISKSNIESAIFFPQNILNVESIDMGQVIRAIIPEHSKVPLITFYVNNLDIKIPFAKNYYQNEYISEFDDSSEDSSEDTSEAQSSELISSDSQTRYSKISKSRGFATKRKSMLGSLSEIHPIPKTQSHLFPNKSKLSDESHLFPNKSSILSNDRCDLTKSNLFPNKSNLLPHKLVKESINLSDLITKPQLEYLHNLVCYMIYARYGHIRDVNDIINSMFQYHYLDPKLEFHNILKSGSFSSFACADKIVRNVTTKLSESYQIKYQQPQENATCEIFISTNGDFVTIRTAIYLIKKDDIIKGDFVVKWRVFFTDNKYTMSLSIPAISLNSTCSFKEQKLIYAGFTL